LAVSATEIIQQIQALPKPERTQVIEYVHQIEDAEIPDSFRQGMADIAAGRVVDMETALRQPSQYRW
jgi:predicted transcriptional regulator